MSRYVVDASTAVKWFVPEVHSADALRLQDPSHELHAPALFDAEIANVLWKKIRRGEITRAEADQILGQLPTLPITRHPMEALLVQAFDLADRTNRTVYDCLYLALALSLGGSMVTADQKLVNSLSATAWAAHVIWVPNIP